jgi:two-component sensor histidine kinase
MRSKHSPQASLGERRFQRPFASAIFASAGPDAGDSPGEYHYRDLLNGIDQGFCIIEMLFDAEERPVDYRFLEINAAFESQSGLESPVGKSMLALRPGHEKHWFDIYGEVALTGEPVRFEEYAAALDRWFYVYAFRVGQSEQRRIAVLFEDITRRKLEEERLSLLAAELNHRARNMLALIAAMIRLTKAETVSEFKERLDARINALGSSYGLLSGGFDQEADLAELVQQSLAAHRKSGEDRVHSGGPSIRLDPIPTQCFGMVLHELATNATKHGALSIAGGKVAISWRLRDDGCLELRWSESDGPAVHTPTTKGLSTIVIESCIQSQLGGEVRFHWRPEGFACDVIVPRGWHDGSRRPQEARKPH